MIKSILLSVDGSIYTEAAVLSCVTLARAFSARVRVLSVIDVRTYEWALSVGADSFVPVIPSSGYLEETRKFQKEKAEAALQRSAELLRREQIKHELELTAGSPADTIYEYSRTVDLVVMGARGEFDKWKRKIIGATLEVVSRQIHKPLLIVSREFRPLHKVLVAYDGSSTANKALAMAGHIASRLALPVTILTVSTRKSEARLFLKEAEHYLKNFDLVCESVIVPGTPEQKITEYAEQQAFDLIVMGAYGRSRIREAILGSTTQTVMRDAQVPVLLSK